MKKIIFILFIILLAACHEQPFSDKAASFPRSEWSRATNILMHTPGEELFDGVIHPSAGLFEEYFDVEKAAEEHRAYISLLKSYGINVHEVKDILGKMDIEKLRELSSETLVYNISDLDPRDTAAFGENYRRKILDKLSRADLIRIILLQPEIVLHSTENNTKVEADYIHHPLMNLYFTRDQSITTPCGPVICRMNSSQRASETAIIRACLEYLGYPPVFELTGEGRLEGGDYLPAGTKSFIGCGMRTNIEAIEQMMESDVLGHDTVVVVYDHLRWQMEMHLDTHFNIIDNDLCTMQQSRIDAEPGSPEYNTADLFVRNKDGKGYHKELEGVGFVNLVRQFGFKIIPIGRGDELHYANNYLTISPRHIIAVDGQSKEYREALKDNGVTVDWLPLENLTDGYGAAHCMTQVLKRL